MCAFYTLSLTQLTQPLVPYSRRPKVGLTLSYVKLWEQSTRASARVKPLEADFPEKVR